MSDRSKLVVLKLDGDLTCQGVRVVLEIGFEDERPQIEIVGSLPHAPQLIDCLEQWQKQYRALGMQTRIRPKEIIYEGSLSRLESCQQLAQQLGICLNLWLASESFRAIDRRLREELSVNESIRVLIRTRDRHLQQLPWCLWDFCDRYPHAEVAIGSPQCHRIEVLPTRQKHRVRILAILGHSQGIDLEADRQILKKLPNADVTWLVEPQRQQLSDRLWEQPWDLLFFAGHSETRADSGRIYLNSQESLSVEELKYALKRAISKGLTVAIFNSCDGLGLARELERLGLSQTIVMREPVPDRVAQAFLKYFLGAFSRGESFYRSARQARERLQEYEHRFPAASLLPLVYQNPAAIPPTWKSLQGEEEGKEERKEKKKEKTFIPWRGQKLKAAFAFAFLSTLILTSARSQGNLQSWELHAFDRLMQLRRDRESDRRILVITVGEADIQYQMKRGMKLQGSLSDSALTQLLQKIAPHQPRAIGSDIVHDFPYDSRLRAQLQKTPYFAICRVGSTDSNLESISPPPSFPTRQLGFTNFVSDRDGTIRRQILGMTSDRTCQTDRSFSLQLALSYLKNPPLKLTSEGLWIDRVLFKPLEPDAGGYQLPLQEALGFQTLVNYRASLPQKVSLREMLNGKHDKQLAALIKERIVLIGVAGDKQDLHATPYSNQTSTKIPGVMCHAQMISHIISAVADGRALLWWWSERLEIAWIAAWSVFGALLVLLGRSHVDRVIAIAIATAILLGICYVLLLIGGWIPLVPSALGLILTGTSVTIYNHFQARTR